MPSCRGSIPQRRAIARRRITEHDLALGYYPARDRKRLTTLDPEVPLNVKAYGTAIEGRYHDDRGGSQ